jgi:hypothetical protein
MKKTNLNRLLKIVIIVAVIVITLSVVYALVVRPAIERANLNACLDDALAAKRERWTEYCTFRGKALDESGLCLLGREDANYLDSEYEETRTACFGEYPLQ